MTRIVLGLIVWTQLVVNWPDRHYTWGDGAAWTDGIRDAGSWPSFLGIFIQADGIWFDLIYLATIAFGFLLMIGFVTRPAAIMALFLWMSLYVANPFVGSGGDAVLRMVLLYSCFTNMGRHWSVDAWLQRRRGEVRTLFPAWFSTTLHNLAVILIVHQVVMVYVASAFWKVQSDVWLDGTAVYYPLQTDAYSPWHDVLHPIFANSLIVQSATYMALVIQLFFPVLLLYRPTRALALVAVTGMHLGIGIFMGIMNFSLVMIAVDMMLISDSSWRRAENIARRVRDRARKGFRGASANDDALRV